MLPRQFGITKWFTVFILGGFTLLVLYSCLMEEARFKISNPQALKPILGNQSGAVRSAQLIEYAGLRANLVIYPVGPGVNIVPGKIDMLGIKKELRYPLRFDFVSPIGRVRFIQAVQGPEIEVLVD